MTHESVAMEVVLRRHLLRTCVAFGWNLSRTAEALKVTSKTVYNHLNRLMVAGYVVNPRCGVWRLTPLGEGDIFPTGDPTEGAKHGG